MRAETGISQIANVGGSHQWPSVEEGGLEGQRGSFPSLKIFSKIRFYRKSKNGPELKHPPSPPSPTIFDIGATAHMKLNIRKSRGVITRNPPDLNPLANTHPPRGLL
jgi:hypothetical protein